LLQRGHVMHASSTCLWTLTVCPAISTVHSEEGWEKHNNWERSNIKKRKRKKKKK
jgi:hypothetical protein